MTKRKNGVRRTFHWTPETNATLIKMRNAQRDWDEISAAMECSVKSARNRVSELRATGVDIWTPLPRHDSQKTAENVETVRMAILAGQSYNATAALVGISRNTAARWVQEMGLESTARGTPAAAVPDLPVEMPAQQPRMKPPPITRGVNGNEVMPAMHPWSWGAVCEPWGPFLDRLYRRDGEAGQQ